MLNTISKYMYWLVVFNAKTNSYRWLVRFFYQRDKTMSLNIEKVKVFLPTTSYVTWAFVVLSLSSFCDVRTPLFLFNKDRECPKYNFFSISFYEMFRQEVFSGLGFQLKSPKEFGTN